MRGAPGKQTVYCAAGWTAPPAPSPSPLLSHTNTHVDLRTPLHSVMRQVTILLPINNVGGIMLTAPCVLVQHVSLFCKYFSLRQITNKIKRISFCIYCFPLILWTQQVKKNVHNCFDRCFLLFPALSQAADNMFIFSQTFYLITVPRRLLVLPLPVCFRGNPSFVSQGSTANWENLKLSTRPDWTAGTHSITASHRWMY